MQESAQPKTLAEIKNPQPRELSMPDLKIDMFSLRGFELAQRIAKAFATSDAVPSIFRTHNLKKDKTGEVWVENPSAFGNCLVAVETAQAVGMSITAVMQNANIIEGKLSWSGKFIIAAVNASRRFTPLRFDIKNKGKMTASYKEKDGWNKEKNKWNMIEHKVELENIECTAWAFIMENGKATTERIEGVPVSMKMAVEEGWYAKSGSKWQTEMKHLMLQYRAGAYFGNIHAPDVVMGMGRSTEELQDINTIDVERQPNGSYAATNLEELRTATPAAQSNADVETVVVKDNQLEDHAQPAEADDTPGMTAPKPAFNPEAAPPYEAVSAQLFKAMDLDALDVAADLIKSVPDEGLRTELGFMFRKRRAELEAPASNPAEPARRTRRASGASVE